jgi:hypothetical protein
MDAANNFRHADRTDLESTRSAKCGEASQAAVSDRVEGHIAEVEQNA